MFFSAVVKDVATDATCSANRYPYTLPVPVYLTAIAHSLRLLSNL